MIRSSRLPIGLVCCLLVLARAAAAPADVECPNALTVSATRDDTDYDIGWRGSMHDTKIDLTLTAGVSACAGGTTPPCGQCTLSGPIANPGGPSVGNLRCATKSWITCASNADCPTGAGACVALVNPPQPLHSAGVSICVTSEVIGSLSGTVDAESGELAMALPLRHRVYIGTTISKPCPECIGAICDSGPAAGRQCVVHGTSGAAAVSFDCPPADSFLGTIDAPAMSLAANGAGTSALTLSAGSPACTGVSGLKCFCPGIGSVPTKPNSCNDMICTPSTTDTDSADEGECLFGPVEGLCSETDYRSCNVDNDCRPPSCSDCQPTETCDYRNRQCFTDNGRVDKRCYGETNDPSQTCTTLADCLDQTGTAFCGGGAITVTTSASPPVDGVATPMLGGFSCVAATTSAAANNVAGLPGPARLTLGSTLTFRAVRNQPFPAVPPSTTVATETSASPGAPVATGVTTSSAGGGDVTIVEQYGAGTPPSGFALLGYVVDIAAPLGSPAEPLTLTFHLDSSILPPGPVQVFRSPASTPIPDCLGATVIGTDDPCITARTTDGDDLVLTILTSHASEWTFGVPNPICGNGDVEDGEECDDGNVVSGDFCSQTCLIEKCAASPVAGCRTPVANGKAQLTLKDATDSSKDALSWKWGSGAETLIADYGTPGSTSGYQLCVYRNIAPQLLLETMIPPGGTCDDKPCWSAKATTLQYKSKTGAADGVTQIKLKAGAAGKAQIQLKGKGGNLGLPAPPYPDLPIVVQMKRLDSTDCWEATYSAASKNEAGAFKAKSD